MWLKVLSAIEEMLDTRPPSDGEPLRSCRGSRGAFSFSGDMLRSSGRRRATGRPMCRLTRRRTQWRVMA